MCVTSGVLCCMGKQGDTWAAALSRLPTLLSRRNHYQGVIQGAKRMRSGEIEKIAVVSVAHTIPVPPHGTSGLALECNIMFRQGGSIEGRWGGR